VSEWDRKLGEGLVLPERALISPGPGRPSVEISRAQLDLLLAMVDVTEALPGTADGTDDAGLNLADLAAKVRSMRNSWSWRVTAPLRTLGRPAETIGTIRPRR